MFKLMMVASSALIAFTVANAEAAPTACKGMDQATCETHEVYQGIKACIWMKERQTASGNQVKAHCRGSNKSVPADAKKKEVTNASQPQQ